MTLQEIQAIVMFAKQARIESMTIDGLSFKFYPRGKKIRKPKVESTPEKAAPPVIKAPTLDDINRFIYQDPPEDKTQ